MKKHDGIPDSMTMEVAKEFVRPRVSEKRFKHIAGVAKVARELADKAHCDADLAEMAGWLHDACKETKDKALVAQALAFGLELTPADESNGHLLHGPVAAEVVSREFDITNKEMLDAIREHTLGAINMTKLSKVVFLADCLEEGRPAEYTDPIWSALYNGIDLGKEQNTKKEAKEVDLDAALLVACNLGLRNLLDVNKAIHPKTVAVRNYYLDLIRQRERKELAEETAIARRAQP